MAFRIHLFSPKTLPQSQNFQNYPKRPKTQIVCASNNKKNNKKRSDAELASDLATEVGKINTHLAQKEEAMKKSKELLFTEFCQYLALERDEVKKEWRKIIWEWVTIVVQRHFGDVEINIIDINCYEGGTSFDVFYYSASALGNKLLPIYLRI